MIKHRCSLNSSNHYAKRPKLVVLLEMTIKYKFSEMDIMRQLQNLRCAHNWLGKGFDTSHCELLGSHTSLKVESPAKSMHSEKQSCVVWSEVLAF